MAKSSVKPHLSQVTHGVSHRGQDHDITPLDAPCLHMNPVSFGSSALHLKRQFTSNKRKNQSLFSPRCGDGVVSVVHEAAKHFFRVSDVPGFVQKHQGSGCFSRKNIRKCLCFTLVASFTLQQVQFTADSISHALFQLSNPPTCC